MLKPVFAVAAVMIASAIAPSPVWGAEHGVIVQYHHVARDTPPSTTITPQDFRRHLEYLRDNGFNVVPLDTMVESLRSGTEIPDRAVAITFDDGYSSIYDTAYPLLKEFGFPFTIFVSTQPIDDEQANFMTWSQLKEMAEDDAIIANHMVNHPYMLEREDGESRQQWLDRLRSELLHAENRIEENTGQSHRYLAYPYGEYDSDIVGMLEAESFTGFAQNSGAMGFDSDFLTLPRYPLASIYADLDTARTKFDSLAFNVIEKSPASPIADSDSPSVRLRFAPGAYNFEQINCFANSQAIAMNWIDRTNGVVELNPQMRFSGRRWRYICTAPLPGSGRYFWYSVQWINPDLPG